MEVYIPAASKACAVPNLENPELLSLLTLSKIFFSPLYSILLLSLIIVLSNFNNML